MANSTVRVVRDERLAFANLDLGLGALNALGSIPGVKNPKVLEINGDIVSLTYEWTGTETFWDADTLLLKHGFSLAENEKNG